jgi:polyisoprenoid-binding protein YceI
MRHFILLCLSLLTSTVTFAASFGTLVGEKSSLTFVSKQMGVPVNGRFQRFQAELNFDPLQPEATRGAVVVELASIDTGSAEANDEVKGKDWFFVKNFPLARFEIRSVKPLGGNRFEIRGPLTIRNVTRDIIVATAFRMDNGLGLFAGSHVLKRLDFGIGTGEWGDPDTVANEVEVRFSLALRPLPSAKTANPKKK